MMVNDKTGLFFKVLGVCFFRALVIALLDSNPNIQFSDREYFFLIFILGVFELMLAAFYSKNVGNGRIIARIIILITIIDLLEIAALSIYSVTNISQIGLLIIIPILQFFLCINVISHLRGDLSGRQASVDTPMVPRNVTTVNQNISLPVENKTANSRQTTVNNKPGNTSRSQTSNQSGTPPNCQTSYQSDGPGYLLRKAADLLHKGDISEALKVEEEAYRLFPNNQDVIISYASMLGIQVLSVENVVGNDYPLSYRDKCNKIIELCSRISGDKRAIEMQDNAYYNLGNFYFLSQYKDHEMAIMMFKKTDLNMYPYAATAIAHIHVMNARKYEKEFCNDAKLIKQTLNSKFWDGNIKKASAYFLLSLFYSQGAPRLPQDIGYAYDCIQKCAALDPEMAKSEIGKYKKGLFGITYAG